MGYSLSQFHYNSGDRNYFPISPAERDLQTIEANYFFQVSKERRKHVEGLCFDREGNLWFVDMYNDSICKLDMNTQQIVQRIPVDPERRATAVKIHKNGRLFVTCIDLVKKGCIYSMNPDGSDVQMIITDCSVDDLVFDSRGGFYYTHFIGTPTDLRGGVYYVSPDFKTTTPIVTNLASPNGVALSTDESVLWISEWAGNRILRYSLTTGMGCVTYHFSCGIAGPDTICVDSDDNLYVALCGHGRVMIFNRNGAAIGQVVLPGRDAGFNLFSTCPAVRPDKKELYIIASDDNFDEGSWIFQSGSFAPGNKNSYQFQ